jgi:hypothetical protein
MAFSPVPESAASATIRPLDKGMHTEIAGQDVPDGGFVDLEGFIGGTDGPRRRPTFSSYAAGQATKYNHRDYATLWLTTGVQISLLFTEKTLYKVNPITGVTEVAWAYSTGTIAITGTAVVGTGTAFSTNDLLPGDVVRVGAEEGIIKSVDSATGITLESASMTNGSGLSYSIQRTFAGGTNTMIDWAIFGNKMLIADGKRPLMAYDPATNTIGYWTTSGANKILATSTAVTSAGTIAVSGSAVTGSSTAWTTPTVPLPGDTLTVNGYSDTIKTVTDATHIVLNHTGLIPVTTAGASYAITRMVGIDMVPNAVGTFNDSTIGLNRVWVGYTYDATDGTQRQRIRWSALADPTNFSVSTNYLDLPYVWGRVLKLVPLAGRLVAYFDDAVFLGSPTNSTLLPLAFNRLETGGVGLAGVKAVCPLLGGHFFVGSDDIYFLPANGVPQGIGTPIVKDTIKLCKSLDKCYAVADPGNFRIIFGFPKSSEFIETIASFDYQSKSWSLDSLNTYAIGNPTVNFANTWDALTGTWDTLVGTDGTWDGLAISAQGRTLFIENGKKVYAQGSSGSLDFATTPVSCGFTTPDHDYNQAEYDKIWTRFGLKISYDDPPAAPIIFNVKVSTNKGRRWKDVGTLTIPVGMDESSVSFRSIGSTCRFKLASTSQVTPYRLSEYSMRARRIGEELAYGAQR